MNLSKRAMMLSLVLVCALTACNNKKNDHQEVNINSVEKGLSGQNIALIDGSTANDAQSEEKVNKIVGVAECDEYLFKYQKCIEKMPEEARELAKKSIMEMAEAWKEAATTPESTSAIGKACKQAHNATRSTLSSFQCEW